jgi:hypothetical protein
MPGFGQPVANQAASRTDLKSVPEGNYHATLEVEGQIRRLNLQVQRHHEASGVRGVSKRRVHET